MRVFNATFNSERAKRGTAPLNLVEFQFSGGTVYLSDRDVTPSGGVAHQGLIKQWGFIDSDKAREASLLGSIENPDFALTIINSELTPFSANFDQATPLESVKVLVYQWFKDTPDSAKELIFSGYVVGEPRWTLTECSLTIGGLWGLIDRTFGTEFALTSEQYPGIDPDEIGKMPNLIYGAVDHVPCRAVESGGVDTLAADCTAIATTLVLSSTSEMASSGSIGIDNEDITYTGKTATTLTGCTRGANDTTATVHLAGSNLWQIQSRYVYQVAGHPVDAIGDCFVDAVRLTSVTKYTGKTGSVLAGYEGQAVITVPARLTRSQAIDLLVTDGISIFDAIAVVDGIGVVDGITVSDTIGILNTLAHSDTLVYTDGIAIADGKTLTDTLAHVDGIAIADGKTLTDTLAHVDGIAVADGKTLTNTLAHTDGIALADSISVSQGSHNHALVATTALPVTSTSGVNLDVGVASNVADGSTATSVTINYRSSAGTIQNGRITANFATYGGPAVSACYLCVTHKSATSGGGKVYIDLATDIQLANTSGAITTQKFNIGTGVPTSFTVQATGTATYNDASSMVYEMWIEVVTSGTAASAAAGVAKAGTVSKSGTITQTGGVTLGGTISKSGTITQTGGVSLGGTISKSGTITQTGGVSLGGTISKTGTISKSGTVSQSGGVSKSGSVAKAGSASKSGSVTRTGVVTKNGTVTLSGNSVADVEIGTLVIAHVTGGIMDDSSGSYTGVANAVVSRPDHVFMHIWHYFLGQPLANITTDAATFFAANSYTFGLLINAPIQASSLLARLALQCRSRFITRPTGTALLLLRQAGLASQKAVTSVVIKRDSVAATRTARETILNDFIVYYDRDARWPANDPTSYKQATYFGDAASQAAYGFRQFTGTADLLCFDAIRSAAMANSVGSFILAWHKRARVQPEFAVFLDNMEIEPGDRIAITHDLNGMAGLVCEVVSARHIVGSGQAGVVDHVQLTTIESGV